MLFAYASLLICLPVLGVAAYVLLVKSMCRQGVSAQLEIPFFISFAGYGAVLLFFVSALFKVWSAMHSIAFVALVVLVLPATLLYSFRLHKIRKESVFHKAAFFLCGCFPGLLASLVGVSLLSGK